jgi:hypothetical protein
MCEPGGGIDMAIRTTREALSRIFYQRCFWLFGVLLTLICAVSFVPPSDSGRLVLNVVNMFVLIATVAAVGRTTLSFAIALSLAIPAMWFSTWAYGTTTTEALLHRGCSAPCCISSLSHIFSATYSSPGS